MQARALTDDEEARSSSYELLRAVCNALEPVSGDEIRKRAIRYGIIWMARNIRKSDSKRRLMLVHKKPITRGTLLAVLTSIKDKTRQLGYLLERQDVKEAIRLTATGPETIEVPISDVIENAEDALERAPNVLSWLQKGSAIAIEKLNLEGRQEGQMAPWDTFDLSTKALCAYLGGEIFRAARGDSKFPSAGHAVFWENADEFNTILQDFLRDIYTKKNHNK